MRQFMKKIHINIILLLLLSSKIFGAAVSDNDGAAFITKAEFDSLKNTFQAALDSYNKNIDSKIDGAINAYISGIKDSKVLTLTPLLDKDGKYGGFLEKWCSATTGAYDTNEHKYTRNTWEFYHLAEKYSCAVSYVEPWFNSWGTGLDTKDWDYDTSKKEKIKLDDGTEIYGLKRMKITNTFAMAYSELWAGRSATWHNNPSYEWTPGAAISGFNNAQTKLKQNVANIPCYASGAVISLTAQTSGYFTLDHTPSYLSWGAITLSTNEVTYSYDKINVNYPLSGSNDVYWDPQDDTSYVSKSDATSQQPKSGNIQNYDTCRTFTKGVWYSGYEVNFDNIAPSVYDKLIPTWCCKTGIKASDEYLVHWNSASKKNRMVKNGLHILELSSKGTLEIKATADVAGKFYVYAGTANTYISNWTSSSFTGSVFNLSANTETTCQMTINNANSNIYIIFLPTSTSAKGILKINSAKLTTV